MSMMTGGFKEVGGLCVKPGWNLKGNDIFSGKSLDAKYLSDEVNIHLSWLVLYLALINSQSWGE
jgi:hypothetical protein